VAGRKETLLLFETTDGHKFGGFTDIPWNSAGYY
jgi:hypothetical protein